MTRRVISNELQAAGGTAIDGYFDRLIKYIPSDIVGAWIAVTGIIPSNGQGTNSSTILWVAFGFGVVITALWVWRQTELPGRPIAYTQIAMATVAFVVWVFALGGPFTTFEWYVSFQGSLALIAYTLLAGLIVPKE